MKTNKLHLILHKQAHLYIHILIPDNYLVSDLNRHRHQTHKPKNKLHYVYLPGFLFATPWNKQKAKTFIRLKAHNTISLISWEECILGKFNQGNGQSNLDRDIALMPCKLLFHNAFYSLHKSWFPWLTQVVNNLIWLTDALVTNNTVINVMTSGSSWWLRISNRMQHLFFNNSYI